MALSVATGAVWLACLVGCSSSGGTTGANGTASTGSTTGANGTASTGSTTGANGTASNGSTTGASGTASTGDASQTSAAQALQFCMAECAKEDTCNHLPLDCTTACAPGDADQTFAQQALSAGSCNGNAFLTSANACISGTCEAFEACLLQAAVSSGCDTMGFNLDGGIDGNAGSAATVTSDGSAPSCTDCTKAVACCTAVDRMEGAGDGGDCAALSASQCTSLSDEDQATFAVGCAAYLSVGRLFNLPACM